MSDSSELHSSPAMARTIHLLRQGGVVALPTETVYGLGARADDELAVRRIFAIKGRPSTHPLIVHVADLAAVPAWVSELPARAKRLGEALWPGPLTLVLNKSDKATDAVTGGQSTVALRVPAHPLMQEVLSALGTGVAAPSANRFGQVSPTRAEHVRQDLSGLVDDVLDGGPCSVGVESTIIDLSRDAPRLLRPGGVPLETIETVLGEKVQTDVSGAIRAPGTLESHYAPRAGVVLTTPERLSLDVREAQKRYQRIAVLAPQGVDVPSQAHHKIIPSSPEGLARELYALLREMDDQSYELVIALLPSITGLGLAIRDRLQKAAAPRP